MAGDKPGRAVCGEVQGKGAEMKPEPDPPLRCPWCGHVVCDSCEQAKKLESERWILCCQCSRGAVIRFWQPRGLM